MQNFIGEQHELDLEIEDEVTWPVLEVEAFLGELEIRHRVGT